MAADKVPLVEVNLQNGGREFVTQPEFDKLDKQAPLLATLYMANESVPVAFIPVAFSGTRITDWLPGVDHSDPDTFYGTMNIQAAAVGAKLVLWWQGEGDACLLYTSPSPRDRS